MGLVLDSSVLIAAEREERPVSELLASFSAEYSEAEFLPLVHLCDGLEHGWHRANTPETAQKRRRYLDGVIESRAAPGLRPSIGTQHLRREDTSRTRYVEAAEDVS